MEGKLTTCNVFTVYSNLANAIGTAAETVAKIPGAGARTSETLDSVISQCEGAIKHARRLKEANS